MQNIPRQQPFFSTNLNEIHAAVQRVDPIAYGNTRNYIDGKVTYLSPYISRGVISTKQVLDSVLQRGFNSSKIEKFIQELAWRDYWQQVWIAKGEAINFDLKQPQVPIANHEIASVICTGQTGIEAVDIGIANLLETGYLHNHLRMYVASIACNIAKSHWKLPAKWLYYHLLDADWASNALSWQWVAGCNSNKKYYANQQNINRYCYTNQRNTFLDVSYEEIATIPIAPELLKTDTLVLKTPLPEKLNELSIRPELPTLIYNFYNLDPHWKEKVTANRILLLEPEHFEAYPVSKKSIDFVLGLAKNIPEIQIFVGSFKQLKALIVNPTIYFKEHPLNLHYEGIKESRDWIFDLEGYYPSFFSFWKKAKKTRKWKL